MLLPRLLALALAGLPVISWADSVATSPSIELKDEGASQGFVKKLDCTGTGVSCSRSGVTGTINVTGGGGGGAPTDATYLTATPDATLTNEIVVGTTNNTIFIGTGATIEPRLLPACANPATDKILFDASTNSFSCDTTQATLRHQAAMIRVSLGF